MGGEQAVAWVRRAAAGCYFGGWVHREAEARRAGGAAAALEPSVRVSYRASAGCTHTTAEYKCKQPYLPRKGAEGVHEGQYGVRHTTLGSSIAGAQGSRVPAALQPAGKSQEEKEEAMEEAQAASASVHASGSSQPARSAPASCLTAAASQKDRQPACRPHSPACPAGVQLQPCHPYRRS